jgi:hypothetical protein
VTSPDWRLTLSRSRGLLRFPDASVRSTGAAGRAVNASNLRAFISNGKRPCAPGLGTDPLALALPGTAHGVAQPPNHRFVPAMQTGTRQGRQVVARMRCVTPWDRERFVRIGAIPRCFPLGI